MLAVRWFMQCLWIKTSQDKYSLPLVVCDTIEELAEECETTPGAILDSIANKEGMYEKVIYEEYDEELDKLQSEVIK